MHTIPTRLRRTVALVAFVALAATAPARAQQSIPDIRGTYPLSGAITIFSCEIDGEGGAPPTSTVPVSIDLVITDQDGAAFSGYLGAPGQPPVYTVTGHVTSEGLIAGTWDFPDNPTPGELHDFVFTGEISNGKAAIELTATFGTEDVSCQYRIALSSDSVILSWVAPADPTADSPLQPPRQLQAVPPPTTAQKSAKTSDSTPTGYNVYRSKNPNVDTTPENLFTSVPPTQTTVPAPDGSAGSFFVVTATYPVGESGPSNEVSGGIPAGTIANVTVKGAKLVTKGKDFSSAVQVLVDGIPFGAPAKVKAGTKVVQKGALLTGESIADYFTSGRTVTVTVRNANGGIATKIYTRP